MGAGAIPAARGRCTSSATAAATAAATRAANTISIWMSPRRGANAPAHVSISERLARRHETPDEFPSGARAGRARAVQLYGPSREVPPGCWGGVMSAKEPVLLDV